MREPSPDPEAQQIFNAIDTDGDGTLSQEEAVAFLLRDFSSTSVLRLLRVLDLDGDGRITMKEWLKGWQSGEFKVEKRETSVGKRPGTLALLSKHLSSASLAIAR